YVDDLIRNPRERLHTKDADQGRQRTSRLDAPPTRDARIFATRHQALIQPLTYRFHTARIRGASKEAHPDARVSSSMLRRARRCIARFAMGSRSRPEDVRWTTGGRSPEERSSTLGVRACFACA